MLLWLAIGVLTALVLVLLLRPLLSATQENEARQSYDIEVYRDQLGELERDLDRGVVNAADAEAARIEIERRMLAATQAEPGRRPAAARRPRAAIPLLAVAVPLVAGGLYLALGKPHLPGQPFAARTLPDGVQTAALRAQLKALEAKVAAEPNKAENWSELGRFLLRNRRFADAAQALGRAMALAKSDPATASAYGEALTQAAKGTVTPKALAAFRTAIEGAPRDPRARFHLGLAEAQAGRPGKAIEQWLRLEADSAAGAPWLPALRRRMAALAEEAKIDIAALRRTLELPAPKAARGPTKEDLDAARRMTPKQRMAMIRGMVQRLEDRLKEDPRDLQGWRRLGRSYAVLGDTKKAASAHGKAAALAPKDTAVLADYAVALLNEAGQGVKLPPAVTKLMRRIHALDAENGLALYYLGIAEAEAGNRDAALAHWRRLLTRLPKDAPIRGALAKRIEMLKMKKQ